MASDAPSSPASVLLVAQIDGLAKLVEFGCELSVATPRDGYLAHRNHRFFAVVTDGKLVSMERTREDGDGCREIYQSKFTHVPNKLESLAEPLADLWSPSGASGLLKPHLKQALCAHRGEGGCRT